MTASPPGGHHAIIMLRHAATPWNEAGRYQGRADPTLSTAGQLAAQLLAAALAPVAVARIVSSPLRRARQTAAAIAQPHALRPNIDGDLIEVDYGAWEGMTQPEVKLLWPKLLRQWKRNPGEVRFPGGETLDDARARLHAFLARLAATPPGGVTVVITHQTIVRLAWLLATGAPAEALRHYAADPAAPCSFVLRDGRLHPSPGHLHQGPLIPGQLTQLQAALGQPNLGQPHSAPAAPPGSSRAQHTEGESICGLS
jgi:probable phosphoglycerate mutase